MSARLLVLGLVLLGSACTRNVGVLVEDFKPAHLPAGIATEVTLAKDLVPGNKIDGELIAVTDKGLTLLLHKPLATEEGLRRLVEVPFGAMRRAKFDQLGLSSVRSEGQAIDDARRDRLRLLSRFPQGLEGELLAQLLATYGEAGIHRIWRSAETE